METASFTEISANKNSTCAYDATMRPRRYKASSTSDFCCSVGSIAPNPVIIFLCAQLAFSAAILWIEHVLIEQRHKCNDAFAMHEAAEQYPSFLSNSSH
jgi:hypothetical protein